MTTRSQRLIAAVSVLMAALPCDAKGFHLTHEEVVLANPLKFVPHKLGGERTIGFLGT